MADHTDVLLRFFDEDWRQVRQEENQRTAFSNIVFLIASAVFGFLAQSGISRNSLPLTILLIVLGVFGGIASEKLYERSKLHMELAWAWRRRLFELHPEIEVDRMLSEAKEIHNRRFPRLLKLHLHHVWLTLDLAIAVAGIILTAVAVFG